MREAHRFLAPARRHLHVVEPGADRNHARRHQRVLPHAVPELSPLLGGPIDLVFGDDAQGDHEFGVAGGPRRRRAKALVDEPITVNANTVEIICEGT